MKDIWKIMKSKVDNSAGGMEDGDWAAMQSVLEEAGMRKAGFWTKRHTIIISVILLVAMGAAYAGWKLGGDSANSTNDTAPSIATESPIESRVEEMPTQKDNILPEVNEGSSNQNDNTSLSVQEGDDNTDAVTNAIASEEVPSNTITTSPSNTLDEEYTNESSITPEQTELATTTTPTQSDVAETDPSAVERTSNQSQSSAEEQSGEQMQQDTDSSPTNSNSFAENRLSRNIEPIYLERREWKDMLELESEESIVGSLRLKRADANENRSNAEDRINREDYLHHGLALDVFVEGATAFNTGLNTFGGGVELSYSLGDWSLATGVHYMNTAGTAPYRFSEDVLRTDTTFVTRYDSIQQERIIRTWVITGPFTGMYVYDTTIVTVTDTVTLAQLDTSSQIINRSILTALNTSYIQIPVLVGYSRQFGNWSYGGHVGVNIRSLTYTTPLFESESALGFDLLIRPSIGYSFTERWSAFIRPNLRIPISSDPILNTRNFINGGVSVGLRYTF